MTKMAELSIVVLVDEAGKELISVNGPIQNKTLCYGLLERAKDAIREFDPAKASGLVVPSNGSRLGL